MKLRSFCATHTFVSVIIGVLLYLLFSNGTLISTALGIKTAIFTDAHFFGDWFVRFYLTDILWSYGLCAALCTVYCPDKAFVWLCAGVAAFCGLLWEIAQYSGNVPGTADFADIAAYMFGAALFGVIYIIRRCKQK